ncbi:MAG: CsgG/HfaB family protein, partial [Gemmatimonadales bacterium]
MSVLHRTTGDTMGSSSRARCALVILLLAACAPRTGAPPVAPADSTALEAERARVANDPDGLTRVGIRFYEAKSFARAQDVLAAALALDPNAFDAAVYLGLAHEGLGEWDAALRTYRQAQGLRIPGRQRSQVEQRIVALTRTRLADEARRAVAAEASLASTPPVPNTVAVLRFSYLGDNADLRPLEVGLSHLVLSDLAKVRRLTLLERERVQALTDELALGASGRVEPATAARSGRLLRAERVVQGAIRDDGSRIRIDAAVVSTADTQVRANGTASDRLEQILAMEKAVVLQLLERLGVTPTPAELRAIEERPTADLQAFLAFSRGLEAEDRRDFSAAARAFQDAVSRDPAFRAARDRAAMSARLSAAVSMS